MDELIAEIRAALDAGLYTIGLQSCLAAVDISAALNSESGETEGAKFRAWFDDHLGESYPSFDAADAYKLRCGMLHQGRASSKRYSAVLFSLPDGRGNVFHNNIIGDALNLDLMRFCNDVLAAVESWWNDAKSTERVARNAEHLVRRRPEGLAPYISGVQLLA